MREGRGQTHSRREGANDSQDMSNMTPGKNPASMMPNAIRNATIPPRLSIPLTPTETAPQINMIAGLDRQRLNRSANSQEDCGFTPSEDHVGGDLEQQVGLEGQ